MSGNTFRQTVRVKNPNGFHMRPMQDFVELARHYQCSVKVSRADRTADGKSILELLSNLLSPEGSELEVEATGPDAREAVTALVALIENSNTTDEPEPPLPPKG